MQLIIATHHSLVASAYYPNPLRGDPYVGHFPLQDGAAGRVTTSRSNMMGRHDSVLSRYGATYGLYFPCKLHYLKKLINRH